MVHKLHSLGVLDLKTDLKNIMRTLRGGKPLWSYKSKRSYHILSKFQSLDHKDFPDVNVNRTQKYSRITLDGEIHPRWLRHSLPSNRLRFWPPGLCCSNSCMSWLPAWHLTVPEGPAPSGPAVAVSLGQGCVNCKAGDPMAWHTTHRHTSPDAPTHTCGQWHTGTCSRLTKHSHRDTDTARTHTTAQPDALGAWHLQFCVCYVFALWPWTRPPVILFIFLLLKYS